MQHVNQFLAAKPQSRQQTLKQTSETSSDIAQKKSLIDALFVKMSLLYGSKWNDSFPTAGMLQQGKIEWIRTLGMTSIKAIERGMYKLLTGAHKHKEWPPTVFQFQDLCHQLPVLKNYAPEQEPQSNKIPISRNQTMLNLVSIKNNMSLTVAIMYARRCKFLDSEIEELLDCDLTQVEMAQ